MSDETKSNAVPTTAARKNSVRILFGLLILWSLMLALGSLLFADSVDWRKPIVVMGTMGLFLGTWWQALQSRRNIR